MVGDVLEKQESGINLSHDPGDLGPEVPGVGGAPAPAGHRKRLAWVAANDSRHAATPGSAVEGGQIAPDRRVIQAAVFDTRRQDRHGKHFPLHVADAASPRKSESHAQVEPANSGAKREVTDFGRMSHIYFQSFMKKLIQSRPHATQTGTHSMSTPRQIKPSTPQASIAYASQCGRLPYCCDSAL